MSNNSPFGDFKNLVVEGRTRVTEYLLRTNGKGAIVSQLGPCVCGEGKRQWHPICLKEKTDA